MLIGVLKNEIMLERFTENPVYEILDFGYDTETGEQIVLPQCDPRKIGGVFDENLNEWIIPHNWHKYIQKG